MMIFRDARLQDDPALTRLIAQPMPGKLSLSFGRQPSYLDACQHCGPPRQVLVASDGRQPVALCSYFLRRYHWDGVPRQAWILSDFRALRQAAGKSVTGRGWRVIRERLQGLPAVISVLKDNSRTLALFQKRRKDWPRLHPVADLCSNLTPLFPGRGGGERHQDRALRPLTPDQVVAFVNSQQRHLLPLIEPCDLGSTLPASCWGVFSPEEELLGCAGLSTLGQHRQVRVHAYHGLYRLLHRLTRAFNLLPEPGSEVPISTASLLIAKDGASLAILLDALKARARQAGSRFLVWCSGEGETPRLRDRFRFRYHSRLYQLLWEGDTPLPPLPGRSAFEVAWL
jgi:hypothetical protein